LASKWYTARGSQKIRSPNFFNKGPVGLIKTASLIFENWKFLKTKNFLPIEGMCRLVAGMYRIIFPNVFDDIAQSFDCFVMFVYFLKTFCQFTSGGFFNGAVGTTLQNRFVQIDRNFKIFTFFFDLSQNVKSKIIVVILKNRTGLKGWKIGFFGKKYWKFRTTVGKDCNYRKNSFFWNNWLFYWKNWRFHFFFEKLMISFFLKKLKISFFWKNWRFHFFLEKLKISFFFWKNWRFHFFEKFKISFCLTKFKIYFDQFFSTKRIIYFRIFAWNF